MITEKDWSQRWNLYRPNQPAISEYESGRTVSYAQLDRQAQNAAFYLQKQYNVKKGDRVAVLAENCIEYVVLFCAAQKAGFILVPLNYRYTAREITTLLEDAKAKVFLYAQNWSQVGDQIKKNCEQSMSVLKWEVFSNVLSSTRYYFRSQPLEDEAPIFILYTSGTTGRPKGVIYTHKMLFWNSINTSMSLIVNSESHTVNCMPPFHTGGWNVLMTPFLHHGGHTILLKKFDPEVVLRILQEKEITIFMGVPTMLSMMAARPEFNLANFPDLYYIIVGGEPMAIPMIEKWMEKGVPIRQGYGMTEAGPNLTSLHENDAMDKKGSIGRPNFYVQHRIVNDRGKDCGQGEKGELWLKGPMVFERYWNQEEATEKAFHESWFRTGDLVIEDEENYLFVVDRIKNMFISGGENVYPAEIEHYLRQHEQVEEIAVIGEKDDTWGEVGHAFIVARSESTLDEKSLVIFSQKGLAKYKVPKRWTFVKALPTNDTGKINKTKLREEFQKT